MEEECGQWERLAGEFAEGDKFYQAANQYKQAASCYLERAIEMTKKAAENYHIYAEARMETGDSKTAATAYFEAATQYRQVNQNDTALTLFENSAEQALAAGMIETAAQAYLWAAYSCHQLQNHEYFLTCAENMARLYSQASEKALENGDAERAVIDLALAAMGLVTIERMDEAKERIAKAKRVLNRTTWDWLKTLVSFSEFLISNKLDEAERLLNTFKEEEAIQEVMGACLSIIRERESKRAK